ncbi:glycosyl hydrolase [Paraglaciecola sp.]|uniref:glycosyl hydrolase n=1 Tax=Paraglaciecola sp. TaxID=1920173 RepID=UPI00273D3E44|nr:glycosyl hydrolase [Paraglaciecola sp.]MDP5030922.1 glycosyl hydrolase [Paraglaciecola sp.]
MLIKIGAGYAAVYLLLMTHIVKADTETFSPMHFETPAKHYLPKTWMHAMNGNLSKPGFTEDFKAMADVGIGGAIFFHVHRSDKPYSSRGPVRFGSDEFYDTLVHAAAEADKNGIEFGIHNSDGWTSSGGPWVTAEMSMKRITWSEHAVQVNQEGEMLVPPQPGHAEGLYQDIAVIALPANKYNQSNAFANIKYTSSDSSLDLSLLADADWDTEFKFKENKDNNYWVQVEIDEPTSLRSLQIETPDRHGEAALQISDDGKNFTTVVEELRRPRTGARMWAFSPQLVSEEHDGFKAKYFRFVFTKPIAIKRFDLWSEPKIDDWLSMNSMERGRVSLAPKIDPQAITKAKDVLVLNRGELPLGGVKLLKGDWRILRFGYTSTGAFNVPASAEGEGLEVDKFDAKALQFHFEQFVGKLLKKVQAKGIKSLKTTEIDSYEVGGQNWTDGIEDTFQEKFGYDLIKWLPLLTGRVIESPAHTGAILQELRQHQSDLMVENYFGEFTRLANQYGLETYIEPYGWGPFDELASGGKADRLMGEFWVKSPFSDPNSTYHGRTSAAISSGHIYGKKIISAESFTSINTVNWMGHPYYYKHHGDHMWARGINETMFHRFAHQPNNHVKPGMTMDAIGSHFDRTQTWWYSGGKDWFKYLARGSFLLQQGVPDADFLVHVGDVAPVRGGYSDVDIPAGFGHDLTNTDVLLNRVNVKDGWLVLPEGTRYKALVLSKTDYLHVKTLKRIQTLVAAGATVIGNKPKHVIGFSEWPDKAEFKKIADALWGETSNSIKPYQKGLVSSYNLAESIKQLKLLPDLLINNEAVKVFAKRRIDDNYLYFFHSEKPEFQQITVEIRDGNGVPEIWNNTDGTIEQIQSYRREGNRLIIDLALEPYASRFILIRRDNKIPDYTGTYSQLVKDIYLDNSKTSVKDGAKKVQEKELTGQWKVEFDQEWAGPGVVTFEELQDWSHSSDSGIKHYSGTAIYYKTFTIDQAQAASNKPIYLDLGEVQQIAEVTINGKKLGTLWKPPFALDVSSALVAGDNQLQVAITNTWVNRLIGDEALPDTSGYSMVGDTVHWLNTNQKPPKSERVTFTGYNFFVKDQQKVLQSSGLIGPVRLIN